MDFRKAYRPWRLIASLLVLVMLLPVAAEDALADVRFCGKNDDMRIALTFDDGPHFRYTEEILEILADYGIPATFFLVGQLAEEYPELVRLELQQGHELASHTWSHPHIREVDEAALCLELEKTEELIYSICGVKPSLFRPPEGTCGEIVRRAAGKMDYDVVLWTVDTRDWDHTAPQAIAKNVISNTRPGSIILCHDFVGGSSPTPEALRIFIPALLAAGYEFVTVSELLG